MKKAEVQAVLPTENVIFWQSPSYRLTKKERPASLFLSVPHKASLYASLMKRHFSYPTFANFCSEFSLRRSRASRHCLEVNKACNNIHSSNSRRPRLARLTSLFPRLGGLPNVENVCEKVLEFHFRYPFADRYLSRVCHERLLSCKSNVISPPAPCAFHHDAFFSIMSSKSPQRLS
jgi:hypothetical protein